MTVFYVIFVSGFISMLGNKINFFDPIDFYLKDKTEKEKEFSVYICFFSSSYCNLHQLYFFAMTNTMNSQKKKILWKYYIKNSAIHKSLLYLLIEL